jgi:hypothetical protein
MSQTILPQLGSPNPGEVTLSGNFVLGSSGAVASQSGAVNSGFTVTQDVTGSAVGRYLVTFAQTYKGLKSKSVSMDGPAAGTAFPTTTGVNPQFRTFANPGKTVSVQFTRQDTMADANPASGDACYLTFVVQR